MILYWYGPGRVAVPERQADARLIRYTVPSKAFAAVAGGVARSPELLMGRWPDDRVCHDTVLVRALKGGRL